MYTESKRLLMAAVSLASRPNVIVFQSGESNEIPNLFGYILSIAVPLLLLDEISIGSGSVSWIYLHHDCKRSGRSSRVQRAPMTICNACERSNEDFWNETGTAAAQQEGPGDRRSPALQLLRAIREHRSGSHT